MNCGNCGSSRIVNIGVCYVCQACGVTLNPDGTPEEHSDYEKVLDSNLEESQLIDFDDYDDFGDR